MCDVSLIDTINDDMAFLSLLVSLSDSDKSKKDHYSKFINRFPNAFFQRLLFVTDHKQIASIFANYNGDKNMTLYERFLLCYFTFSHKNEHCFYLTLLLVGALPESGWYILLGLVLRHDRCISLDAMLETITPLRSTHFSIIRNTNDPPQSAELQPTRTLESTSYGSKQGIFFSAIDKGALVCVSYMLKMIDVNVVHEKTTPLLRAIRSKNIKMVQLILDAGADLNSPYNAKAIDAAIVTADVEIFKLVAIPSNRYTPFALLTALSHDNDIFPMLLDDESQIKFNNNRTNILHLFAARGDLSHVRRFYSPELLQLNKFGAHPIHFAVVNSRLDVVRFFLEQDPQLVHIRIDKGTNLLMFSLITGLANHNSPIIKFLLDSELDYSIPDDEGYNLFHYCCELPLQKCKRLSQAVESPTYHINPQTSRKILTRILSSYEKRYNLKQALDHKAVDGESPRDKRDLYLAPLIREIQ